MTQNLVQGSPEWIAARLGHLTASPFHKAIAKTKSGWSTSRYKLMAELICERQTGVPTEHYQNTSMQRGTELEPEARAAYQFDRLTQVVEVGFIKHPTIAWSGASPDGLVGEHGLVECKCPDANTHMETLLTGNIDGAYITQMMWQMSCTRRHWCDFVSYDPRWAEEKRLFVRRIERDDKLIEIMEGQAVEFLRELEAKMAELDERYPPRSTEVAA